MFEHDTYKQFAIVHDVQPRSVALHVFGDVDLSTVGELKDAIDEIAADGDQLLIDLSRCRYFDSSGLAALIQARKILGARLTILVDPKSPVCRVMHIVGFDKLFTVVMALQTARRDDVAYAGGYDASFVGQSSSQVQPISRFGFAPQH